jgi:protein ImuB
MRFACLYVPDFPLAAVLRGEPELRGEPVVVVDGPGPRTALRAVSPAAARRGVAVGASVAQAMAITADLVVRVSAPDALRAAQAALCDAAGSVSPRIEDAGNGVVYLDLQGLAALYESESQLANVLAQRAVQIGLDAQVGVGGSKVAAFLAARNGGGVVVIPAGEEWSFLAPVPVALLAPSPSLVMTLQRWGIRTIGDLAALPACAVGTRLGPEGVLLVRRARGEDEQPLVQRVLPLHFEEALDLEYGVDNVEACAFVLRGMLTRLTARLAVRGLVCGDLHLSLRLATRGRDERTVGVAVPSNDVKALLALARLHLETHPPLAAVEAIRLNAVPERLRAAQLDLFRPNGPAPAQLAVTLARLTALCGADRVGIPVVVDSHRPDAYGVQAVRGLRGYGVRGEENAFPTIPLTANPLAPNSCPLALRAFRPPHAVEVFCERDRPEFVRGDDLAGRVVHAAGPWRVHGDWWHDGTFSRDYYDAQLSDGCVYRLYHDLATQHWFVDGVYD